MKYIEIGYERKKISALKLKVFFFIDYIRCKIKNLMRRSSVTCDVKPPIFPPYNLQNEFTMNGKAISHYWYLNEIYPDSKPIVYNKEQIDVNLNIIKNKLMPPRYEITNMWLYYALEKYPIQGKSVGIFGSISPWFESVCLYYGGQPTTVEYQRIISKDWRVNAMTVSEYDQSPIEFDASFSISSFEHDGLGRFGDPIDPMGDLKAMKKMKDYIKKDGYLFLSIPVGVDALVWNAHRIYGQKRMSMLFEDWELVDSWGFEDKLFDMGGEKSNYYQKPIQPVFVLKNV